MIRPQAQHNPRRREPAVETDQDPTARLTDVLGEAALRDELTWQEVDATLRAAVEVPPGFEMVQAIYEALDGTARVDWPARLAAFQVHWAAQYEAQAAAEASMRSGWRERAA